MLNKRHIFYAVIFHCVHIFGTVTIDIDLPGTLKNQFEKKQKAFQNVCFTDLGCYPKPLPKDELKLTVQLVTDKDLSLEDLKKVQQAVEQAGQGVNPIMIKGNAQFTLMPYNGTIENFATWPAPRAQYLGDWVVFELEVKDDLANLLKKIREELDNVGIKYEMHNPFIAIGFVRFNEVKEKIKDRKDVFRGLGFPASYVQINKITLKREVGKDFDRITVNKEKLDTYPLGRKIAPEEEFMNALNNLEGALDSLIDALQVK